MRGAIAGTVVLLALAGCAPAHQSVPDADKVVVQRMHLLDGYGLPGVTVADQEWLDIAHEICDVNDVQIAHDSAVDIYHLSAPQWMGIVTAAHKFECTEEDGNK